MYNVHFDCHTTTCVQSEQLEGFLSCSSDHCDLFQSEQLEGFLSCSSDYCNFLTSLTERVLSYTNKMLGLLKCEFLVHSNVSS